MPSPLSEDQLVEQPAIELFQVLGWEFVNAYEEQDADGFGRETRSEVVLRPRLLFSLRTLNPDAPEDAIQRAADELSQDLSTWSPVAANRKIHDLILNGVLVDLQPSKSGNPDSVRLRVVDWENPTNNDFLIVSQFTVVGSHYTRRPDLVGFLNGLPLLLIELKKPGVAAVRAYEDNIRSYKADIPQLFHYNAFIIASNGLDTRLGSFSAPWEHLAEWKRAESEDEPAAVSLEKAIRGTCEPGRFLDLVENFILYSDESGGTKKLFSKNHQYLGVNNALKALDAARGKHGRIGVFWHTQGSGKSYSMVFFARKVLRKVTGNWTFVVITDRTELDDQISETFARCDVVSETESKECRADSGADLRRLLKENHRFVFTLIQKFRAAEFEEFPVLSERSDIIVLTDEAHRSQYDVLAMNMRRALPNALFLAFTGTPLIAGEEKTKEVFGDYISVYDFKQSVEDNATVPLYYENRTPVLHLENPNLNDDIYQIIEDADLSVADERKIQRDLGRQYHILTRQDRLEKIAGDIVSHYLDRGYQGKAMVISIDKATAVRMHDLVQAAWNEELNRVKKDLQANPGNPALQERRKILETTDMAVVVSSAQNEAESMKELGLDILPHRDRMNKEDLASKFKEPEDPLRLVFVCAMWLTGFDAPSCSTIYLDKPMRNHTLMQTIARANRVWPGKKNGLIVDYANVFASLEEALSIYGKGKGGDHPVEDKSELINELMDSLKSTEEYLQSHGMDLKALLELRGMELQKAIGDAANEFCSPDPVRQEFIAKERKVLSFYQAAKPDPALSQIAPRCALLGMIGRVVRERTAEEGGDPGEVMAEIQRLLDASIAAEGFEIAEKGSEYRTLDLSKIDFEALQEQFKKSDEKKTLLERLKAQLAREIGRMIDENPTRYDFREKFEELIQSYNEGSRTIEEAYKALLALSKALTEEQSRAVQEELSPEELAIFDLLMKPAPDLKKKERSQVKAAARELLESVKEALVLDWRKRSIARAQVRLTIEEVLDKGLPRDFDKELYEKKVTRIFQHIYEKYESKERSVYSVA
ncbi:MAG: deoxyribonuclease HsdR [Spirochaetaceae bacterium]|nr:deoxyribonuclease HsdR [Spirochaetaceae bacterium]|tara:strand:+ start:50783 stop:53929 length:3147 start_codon:yes stop_codon:yes gene_type:complete